MKKKNGDGRVQFLNGWKKYLKAIGRKKKVGTPHSINLTNLSKEVVSSPVIEKIDEISKLKTNSVSVSVDGKVKVPKYFSLYTHPEVVLGFIHAVTAIVSRGKHKSITLDYSRVRKYCVGAECLLALALSEARKANLNFPNDAILINGVYPKNTEHLEIIRDIGIVKELKEVESDKVKDLSIFRDNPMQRIFKCDSKEHEVASAYAVDAKNNAAQDFSRYLSKCLEDHKVKLNDKATGYLTSCMGELLDNAERHSGMSGRARWYLRGYVDNSSKKPVCEISIFNFGMTIAETFNDLPSEHYSLSKQIKPYIAMHSGKKGMFNDGLVTIAALQGRVSCQNVNIRDSSGTGTIELLKFFQDMHDELRKIKNWVDEKPIISLITGDTHIIIDGEYPLKVKESEDGGESYRYPFNNIGLEVEPDRTYLIEMKKVRFPGLMVNIRFPLEKTLSN